MSLDLCSNDHFLSLKIPLSYFKIQSSAWSLKRVCSLFHTPGDTSWLEGEPGLEGSGLELGYDMRL